MNDSDPVSAGDGWTLPETDAPTEYAADYAAWQADYLAPGRTLADLDLNADPDGDGIINKLEYKFGTHPLESDLWPVTGGMNGDDLELTYPDVESRTDILLDAATTTNLAAGVWSTEEVAVTDMGQQGNAVMKTGTVPADVPVRFLRLEVTEF